MGWIPPGQTIFTLELFILFEALAMNTWLDRSVQTIRFRLGGGGGDRGDDGERIDHFREKNLKRNVIRIKKSVKMNLILRIVQ